MRRINLTRRELVGLGIFSAGAATSSLASSLMKGSGQAEAEVRQPVDPMPVRPVTHLRDIALHCRRLAWETGNTVAGATREFLAASTIKPPDVAAGYYAKYTAPKNWDVITAHLWAAASGMNEKPPQVPELLCYDYTDLMIMILAELGVKCRSVRAIAVSPLSFLGEYPLYLDHVMAEVWTGKKWSAQDVYYNCEYLLDGYYASADDLCSISDLDQITPRNKPLGSKEWQTGWHISDLQGTLRIQDYYAAIEHRDDAGNSVVIMNWRRGDFERLFKTSQHAVPRKLKDIILMSLNHDVPTVIELGAAS